ncbi:hypothetical protein [Desulfosporosinus sp. Sb-LF]|uniref:hypothetical protein n=1 Tax=Desulfosporosinus sp. Sb-LF TaxID=2560027 RepID=UPI00107F2D01|nr:hypothetical protein [Desulfosporosinus sp. Sb-LF]TGE33792.1 hypothetical protein E4K68_02940 [Desulfosporosinus sp. Sb-LF]
MRQIKLLKILYIAILSLIITFLSTVTWLHPIFMVKNVQDQQVKIIATDTKDYASFGTEVRIVSITTNANNKVDLRAIPLETPWKRDGDLLVCYDTNSPAGIIVNLKALESLDIEFVKQRGSGKVDIQFGEVKETVNLYKDTDWEKFTWHWGAEKRFRPLTRPDLLVEIYIMIAVPIAFILYRPEKDK